MDTDVIKLIESKHEVTILGGLDEFVVKFFGPNTCHYWQKTFIGWITFRVITVGQDEWMDTGDDNPDTATNTCAPSELRMSIT